MTDTKVNVKINRNHGGKEFRNYFRLIGQVKKNQRKEEDNWVEQPFFQETTTRTTKKPRRVLEFILETAKGNELRIENSGMIRDYAYAYSSTDKKTHRLNWDDRHDKSKLPNETYHLMLPEWDLTEELSKKLEVGAWVEVKGNYQFDSFANDEDEVINLTKRLVTEINPIEDGQEIRLGQDKFNYVTDFDSPDFREVNTFRMQIGIRSTYQDEETKDTKVNATYLSYGKDRSTPNDVELTVYYQEPQPGRDALADSFARLNRFDFMEVQGSDHNRTDFTYVEVEEKADNSNPFANVDEENKVSRMKRVSTGGKKGLEITGYIQGTYFKQMLTEEEITPVVQYQEEATSKTIEITDDMLPF